MERITNYKEYLAQPIGRLFLHKLVDVVSIYPEDFDTVYASGSYTPHTLPTIYSV